MRLPALPLLLLLVAGCASPTVPEAEAPEAQRSARASDGTLEALLVRAGSPFTWDGATDSCTGLEMPSSCAGQALDGSGPVRIGIAEEVQALRLTVAWTADGAASETLELVVFANEEEVARASGPSPLGLDVPDPPGQVGVLVRVPEPEVARVGDGSTQAFQGRAEAV